MTLKISYRRLNLLGFVGVVGCTYTPPLDLDTAGVDNAISGTIVVDALDAGGPAFVLLYDVNDPPPPAGTGRPLNLASVPETAFSGSAGVQSAPFAMSGVADGTWLVTALIDRDRDFHPLVDAAAGATCGDLAGADPADVTAGEIGAVTVSGGELMSNITVAVATEYTTERPAFVFDDTGVSAADGDQTFRLQSAAIHSPILDMTGPYDAAAPDLCDTNFLVYAPDADADGYPDPHPTDALAEAGAYDIWPRVYASYLGPALNDASGTVLAEGESYNRSSPLTELTLVFTGAALYTDASGAASVVGAPAGQWSVSVISYTGQTWTVPNALSALGTTDASFDPAGQEKVLNVE